MSTIQVNGQSVVPPGFRFHPTEEELLSYYLRKKVSSQKIDLEVIRDVDLNKLEPWDIQEKCRIGSSTPQSDWYFFSHKDKKYPTGTRTNRATAAGFWKATGRDKLIYSAARRIGMRKTLVFYKGRAPHGQKSDWIMHEYRLDDHPQDLIHIGGAMGETTTNRAISDHNQDEGWVVCRVFKKKNLHHHHHKPSVDAGGNNSSSATSRLDGGGALDQILQFMGTRSCKWERGASCSTRNGGVDDRRPRETAGGGLLEMFMKLPALESPNINYNPYCSFAPVDGSCSMKAVEEEEEAITGDWTAFDRLLASQLDGSTNGAGEAGCFGFEIDSSAGCRTLVEENEEDDAYRPRGDGDLWSLTRTTSAISDNTSRASR